MSDAKPEQKTWHGMNQEDAKAAFKPYFDWIRQVITLATASLTALIALQGHYIPRHPSIPWAIQSAWVALAVSILSGLYALRWEYQAHMENMRARETMRATRGEAETIAHLRRGITTETPALHKTAVRLMYTALVIALCMLCLFASLNIDRAT